MAKITTASYIIVAVCIFQIADAGLLANPLSLLNNAQERFTDTLQTVKTLGDGLHGKDLLKLDQNTEIGLPQKILQIVNTTECINVRNKGQEIISKLTSNLNSCIMSETQELTASVDIQKLSDMINDLYTNLEKEYQNALQCSQNPWTMIPCLFTVSQNVSKLVPIKKFEEVVSAGHDFVSNVKTCSKTAYLQSSQQNVRELVKDAGQCFESVFQGFI